MGREHDHTLSGGQLAAAADLGDERVEHFAVERARLSVARQQRAQVVLAVVVLVQLEHRFARNLSEPDYRIDLTRTRPFDFTDDPRRSDTGEIRGGREIDVEDGVRVLLEVGSGDIWIGLALDGAPDDGRLVLAGGDESDLARLHDARDAHGDRFGRDVVL